MKSLLKYNYRALCECEPYKARTIIACLNPSVRQFNNVQKKMRNRNNSICVYIQCASSAKQKEMRGQEWEPAEQCRSRESDLDQKLNDNS